MSDGRDGLLFFSFLFLFFFFLQEEAGPRAAAAAAAEGLKAAGLGLTRTAAFHFTLSPPSFIWGGGGEQQKNRSCALIHVLDTPIIQCHVWIGSGEGKNK